MFTLPEVGSATPSGQPLPLDVQFVALLLDHVSTAFCPTVMVLGVVTTETAGGPPAATICRVADPLVDSPYELAQLSPKVKTSAKVAAPVDRLPEVGSETPSGQPFPLVVHPVELVLVQAMVDACPTVMFGGVAVTVTTGGMTSRRCGSTVDSGTGFRLASVL